MASRQGTILKKCACADPERCSHKWTLRYWADGRQREQSFADELDGRGRPRYGSGKRLAKDAQLKIAHDKRARVFIDPKLGQARFSEECERWISRHPGRERTKQAYRSILSTQVGPVLGDRALASVAQARDDVSGLLLVRMANRSTSQKMLARSLITNVLDEAVTAGKIPVHRCGGIALPPAGYSRADFVFPSFAQLEALAGGFRYGLTIWLMRGCGLRISEALAVQKSCFRENGTVLRIFEQASKDGRETGPLKHRKEGEYRDIPVPSYLWDKVRDLPAGYLFMRGGPSFADGGRLPLYNSYIVSFRLWAGRAGIADSFTPHSLRHAFASALLSRLVPITDVALWLGHRNINVTYSVYGHLVPSSAGRGLAMLNDAPMVVKVFFGRTFVCWMVAEGGHDRDGPLRVEGRLLSGHEISKKAPGRRRIVRRPARLRQPISGPGRPGELWRQPRR